MKFFKRHWIGLLFGGILALVIFNISSIGNREPDIFRDKPVDSGYIKIIRTDGSLSPDYISGWKYKKWLGKTEYKAIMVTPRMRLMKQHDSVAKKDTVVQVQARDQAGNLIADTSYAEIFQENVADFISIIGKKNFDEKKQIIKK